MDMESLSTYVSAVVAVQEESFSLLSYVSAHTHIALWATSHFKMGQVKICIIFRRFVDSGCCSADTVL